MGATLGSSKLGPNTPKSGHEYFVDFREIGKSLISAGFYRKAWESPVAMPFPEVGYFEDQSFDPGSWDPNYPNPAFQRCTDRDGYWGAKIVTSFTDQDIAAIVESAQFRDPKAANEMVKVLAGRRDAVSAFWFARSVPLDRFRIVGSRMMFEDVGQRSNNRHAGRRGYRMRFSEAGKQMGKEAVTDENFVMLPDGLRDVGHYELLITPARKKRASIRVTFTADRNQRARILKVIR